MSAATYSHMVNTRMLEFPPFRLDNVNQCLWRQRDGGEDECIRLTPKPFAILRYLVEHAGRLVTQDELLNAVWPDTFVQPEVLKTHILDVRNALGDSAKSPRFIETLPRRGYQFIAPVRSVSATPEATAEAAKRDTSVSPPPTKHVNTPPATVAAGYTEDGNASWYGVPRSGARKKRSP